MFDAGARWGLHIQRAYDALACGVVVYTQTAQIAEANAAACRMLGVPPEKIRGRRMREICDVLGEDGAPLPFEEGATARVLATCAEQHERRVCVVLADGTRRWLHVDAVPMFDGDRLTHVITSLIDVTKQKLAEEKLARSEANVRAIYDAMACGVLLTDAAGIVEQANAAAQEILGVDRGALRGHAVDEVCAITDENGATVPFGFPEPRAQNGAQRSRIFHVVRPDGELRWLQADAVLIPSGSHADGGVISSFLDVTDGRKLQEHLLLSERLASVGLLAAGVAHEINNPLASIVLNLELLRSELASGMPPTEDLLGEIKEGLERIRVIVRDLRIFSRADEQSSTAVDVRRVLDLSLRMTRNEVRHRARIVQDYGETPLVQANEARLGQVFVNLLINAAQAIEEGHADENEIRLVTRIGAGGFVDVTVSDSGCGIPEPTLGRIFDPFFTTKPVGVGTGLGLAICHRIVASFGGEIKVESHKGRGTSFHVLLPRSKDDQPGARLPSLLAPSMRRARVLVVDDEVALCTALRRTLGWDYDVTTAHDGRQALAMCQAPDAFDLILCDMMMPTMTGMDLFHEIQRDLPALAGRIVFMTGGIFSARVRDFLGAVPNVCLDKPLDMDEVRERVRRFVR